MVARARIHQILTEDQRAQVRNTVPGDSITLQMPDGSSHRYDITEENEAQIKNELGGVNPQDGFSMASAQHTVRRIDQFSLATCAYLGEVVAGEVVYVPDPPPPRVDYERESRKRLKAEAKAQELLRQMIGVDQWRVYRKSCRVIVKPGGHFWVIGDMFGNYNKFNPFQGKPDVIRVDNAKKLHLTEFCVDQAGGDQTPYTDKVITFTTFLINDEPGFVKTINRIGERTLNEMKPCAIWEVKK